MTVIWSQLTLPAMDRGQVLEMVPVTPLRRWVTTPSTVIVTQYWVRSQRMVCHWPSFRLRSEDTRLLPADPR